MKIEPQKPERLRDSKRRQTLELIAETGLKLFIEKGYEGTTLDEIAAAVGISRRTFFYYFKSKEDVLLARSGADFQQTIRATMLKSSPKESPLDAARKCILKVASSYETKEAVVIDRLILSTEALRVRLDTDLVEKERVLLEAICEVWPSPGQRDALRIVVMMAMGTLRLALEDWRRDNAKHPLSYYLRRSFAHLEAFGRGASLSRSEK